MVHCSRARIATGVFVVLLLAMLPALIEAIYVTPHAVFMADDQRSAQVTIGNSGDQPEEATIELQFGFPDTDSNGTPFIRFVEDPGSRFPSAAEWIRAFPRRVQLAPGDQQIVRLLATPPDDLPDGEYWTRMIITSRGTTARVATTDTAVSAGLSLVIRLITSVTYRKGAVSTGVTVRQLTAMAHTDSIEVWMAADRDGNGAYLGTAYFELLTSDGAAIGEWPTPLAIYYPINRRFVLPTGPLAPGRYVLRLRLAAERPDLPEGRVLPAAVVRDSVSIEVP
jgi:hypothetical protein